MTVNLGIDIKLTLKDGTQRTSVRQNFSSKAILLVDFMGAIAFVGNPTREMEDGDVLVRKSCELVIWSVAPLWITQACELLRK